MRYEIPESSYLVDNPPLSIVALCGSCSCMFECCEMEIRIQVFLGGLSFEAIDDCLFAFALSLDVGLMQLHAHVPLLSTALVEENLCACLHLASILRFLVPIDLHSEWLCKDIEALSSGLIVGVLYLLWLCWQLFPS